MSIKLTSGSDRDDDTAPASGQASQAGVLEELERVLEASLAEIEVASGPANPQAGQDGAASSEHEPAEPAAEQAEDFHLHGLRARAAPSVTATPPWLTTSPPFVPNDRSPWPEQAQSIRAAAAGNGTEPLRPAPPHAERMFGQRTAPVFPRIAHPQPGQPANDLRSERPPRAAVRCREPSRHGYDDAWQDDVLRRLAQRPPAQADEVLDDSFPPRSWLVWAGHAAFATVLAGGVAFCLVQFLNLRPASNGGQEKFGIASLSTLDAGTESKLAAPGKSSPRLITSALSGAMNRPVAFGVNVEGAAPGASIVIRGMPAGSRMTAGTAEAEGTWRVPIRELARAAVMPPPDFVGTMNLSVDLRLADSSVADSDVQQLKWTASVPDFVVPKPVTTTVVKPDSGPFPPPVPGTVENAPAAAGGETQVVERQSGRAQVPTARQLERDEIANLLRRGQSALQNGDIAAARLLLRRAAEAGNAQAAMALAATYDPTALKELGALGTKADVAQARLWYRRAADAGSAEAMQRLQQMAQQSP
jgi:hypothetical protein